VIGQMLGQLAPAAAPAARAASPVELWREAFDPVNGGDNQSCHGPHGDWDNPYRIHHRVLSLENCQDLCKNSFRCTGLGYTEKTHLCEVWTKPIRSSDAQEGKQCFRYQPRGFTPVSGGIDQACAVSKSVKAESGKHYVEHRVHSLYECKVRCHADAECLGVDYDYLGRGMLRSCQTWMRPVLGSKNGTGHLCLRREPSGFMPQEKGLYHECTLDKHDDDTTNHSKVHSGDHSLYECQARCAHHGVKCTGINYDGEAGTCEMWTLPINYSKKVSRKSACLRFEAPPPDSLYCVALMVPWTDEPVMLEAQLKHRLGIFACDGFAVFSNPVAKLGHLKTKLIDMDLHATIGGEYHTSLNTPMFAKLWELVGSEGAYKDYDWMVKADPDTVFFPERLRWIVGVLNPITSVSENGAFLNNCQLGFHGPLEVINLKAFDTYLAGNSDCWQAEQEDVYMENCFHTLEVDMINNFDTIAEKDCWRGDWHQYPDWEKCETSHAAFHPFKGVKDYHECWGRAMKAGNWPPGVLHDRVH